MGPTTLARIRAGKTSDRPRTRHRLPVGHLFSLITCMAILGLGVFLFG
jgi:hypothetical protein